MKLHTMLPLHRHQIMHLQSFLAYRMFAEDCAQYPSDYSRNHLYHHHSQSRLMVKKTIILLVVLILATRKLLAHSELFLRMLMTMAAALTAGELQLHED